ncbi:TetR family transcriptional regulator [Micromonospora sp. CPCC 205371]|nr:TetR family transcriptional regulator [Micromonospora sp. CPCC 205371]
MANRREVLLDAAISVLGESGIHGLTHRAVDAAAGLPSGSTSNHFRTREALLDAVVGRFVVREQANWEEIATTIAPTTPRELAETIAAAARDSAGRHKTLTLARYAILVEAATTPALRARLTAGGARVRAWVFAWLRLAGSTAPERDGPIIMNYVAGLVLHQMANPDPAFDPTEEITTLVTSLIRPKEAAHDRS